MNHLAKSIFKRVQRSVLCIAYFFHRVSPIFVTTGDAIFVHKNIEIVNLGYRWSKTFYACQKVKKLCASHRWMNYKFLCLYGTSSWHMVYCNFAIGRLLFTASQVNKKFMAHLGSDLSTIFMTTKKPILILPQMCNKILII